jgi:uncharacterized protein (AIM24 family)
MRRPSWRAFAWSGISGRFPGSIRPHELDGELVCEKHAYLAHGDVEIDTTVAQPLGMGIRGGGEGFFLQRVKGRKPSGCTAAASSSTSTSRPDSG